jgi:hypothetical protein
MSNVPPSPHVDQSFSLSALFLLTAACASVVALITPLARGRVGEDIGLSEFAFAVIAGGLLLGAIGMVLGLFHYRRMVNALAGLLLGILLGVLAGPLAFVPPEDFSYVLLSAAGGVITMLGLATAVRLAGGGWSKGDVRRRSAPVSEPKRHPLDPDPVDES